MRVLLTILFVTSAATSASAQDAEQEDAEETTPPEQPAGAGDARSLFDRGQAAYRRGDYEEALVLWQRVFELDPLPRIQYNLAQAFERLGRANDAADALEQYLTTAEPDDPYQSDARARLASLRERIGRTGIRIVNAPDGASISIDDEAMGGTPHPDPITVEPGTHQVTLRLEGHLDFNSRVAVGAGQVLDVDVAMEEAPEGALSPFPFVLMGAGGAFAIIAGLLGLAAASAADAALTKADESADSARGLAAGADLVGGISFLLVAGGFIWFLLDEPSDDAESASVRVSPYAGATEGGLAVEGGF